MENIEIKHACSKRIMAVQDTMDVLSGKWKIAIISVLGFGPRRYSELLKEVSGISGKVLSRELKDLELNLLLKRTVLETQPVTVLYELTAYCDKLLPIIHILADWGANHKLALMGKEQTETSHIDINLCSSLKDGQEYKSWVVKGV